MASSLPFEFPVCEVEIEKGRTRYLLCVPKQGDHPFTYMCNTLIINKTFKIVNKDIGKMISIPRETLLDQLIPVILQMKDSFNKKLREKGLHQFCKGEVTPTKLKQDFISCLKSLTKLEPSYEGVDKFKKLDTIDGRLHPYLSMAEHFLMDIYHGYALEVNDDLIQQIGEMGFSKLRSTLKDELRRPPLDVKWTLINQFLSQPSQYVLSCLYEDTGTHASIFYWDRRFSTVKIHGGTLYVLDCSTSSSMEEVVWQNFSVITETGVENPDNHIFFDNLFQQIDQNKLSLKHCDDDGESESTRKRKTKTELVCIIEEYGERFLLEEKLLSRVKDSIQRNTRVFLENLQQVSSQMPTILTDHLAVYRICGTTQQSLKAVREIRSSVLSLVTQFLGNAEVSEQVEQQVIGPLVATIMQEYFTNGHLPSEFQFLSMAIVKNCKETYEIFVPVFYPVVELREAQCCLPQFCLLANISSHQFELLDKLPLEAVLIGFSKALKENTLSIDDNLIYILELLENFEKNIKCDNLVGMNDKMKIILETIVPVYRHATISISEQTLRSLKSGVFKLVEAFIEKAQGFEELEINVVIPLMHDAINCCMQQGTDQITTEFASLSKMVMKKCREIHTIFGTLFDKLTTRCEDHHAYFFMLLGEACIRGVITKLTGQQLSSAIEFSQWAIKQITIREAGVELLMKILKAFEVPKFHDKFYRDYLLKIVVEDVFEVLLSSPDPELESLVLELLKQLCNLVDKMSEPIWHQQQVPIHYNQIFVKEHVAKFVSSKLTSIPYSKVTKFVDGVYAARNSSGFFETSKKLLIQLSEETSTITISNETQEQESSAYPTETFDLHDATCENHFKERFQVFFKEYTQDHCHSPYYKGVVYSMYITGQNELKIDFNHILSHDPVLANDLVDSYTRFEPVVKLTVSQYVSECKNYLDTLYKEKESDNTLYTQSLCGDHLKVVIDSRPSSMINFAEFMQLPGNEITKDQKIFAGPHEVEVQNKTDLGLVALCSYIQEMCELHAAGYTFDGNFTLLDFKVLNKTVFKICAAKICISTSGKSNHETERRDFGRFATDFLLPCYGDSAFIRVLAQKMKSYLTTTYSPEAARQFRLQVMTHLAGKNSVVKALLFVDLFRAFRLLGRYHQDHGYMPAVACPLVWREKVKISHTILKNLYNFKSTGFQENKNLENLRQDLKEKLKEELRIVHEEDQSEEHMEEPEQTHHIQEPEQTQPQPFVGMVEHGDTVYDDTIQSFIDYVRHCLSHIGDPNNAGKSTRIRKLIELEMIISHFLSTEMDTVLQYILDSRQIPKAAIEMIEESWKVYIRLESNLTYSEPLGLPEFGFIADRSLMR